jgi:cob(I)alamin adenosyltransferase
MVILNKIYTKTGDDGTTALGSGERRKKFDLRVSAYGTIDEANAVIGVARLFSKNTNLDKVLELIQNDLFDLGADLAVPEQVPSPTDLKNQNSLRIIDTQIATIENHIDNFNADLEALQSFILSGGNELAAHLHLARTIVRRAEREIVELSNINGELVNPLAIKYTNRLSDLLFVLARVANNNGKDDILWVPGKNR